MNILEFKNVSFSYEGYSPTIKNLSFTIDKPKFVSIIGASGCGKSTIFKLILSLLNMQSGSIFYKGKNINTLRSYAGYMPQKDLLFPWKNIKNNLSIPMDIKNIPKKEKEKKISSVLEDIGLSDVAEKMPYELSGGMRQRISFARTILTDSDLLLFDEPLSALDYITRIQMQSWLLDRLNKFSDKTAIFITHDVEEAIFLSDTILVVKDVPIQELIRVDVPLSRNRTRDMLDKTEMINLKNNILSMLKNGGANE